MIKSLYTSPERVWNWPGAAGETEPAGGNGDGNAPWPKLFQLRTGARIRYANKITNPNPKKQKLIQSNAELVKIQFLRHTTSTSDRVGKSWSWSWCWCASLLRLHSRTTRRGRVYILPDSSPWVWRQKESRGKGGTTIWRDVNDWVCFVPEGTSLTLMYFN